MVYRLQLIQKEFKINAKNKFFISGESELVLGEIAKLYPKNEIKKILGLSYLEKENLLKILHKK